MVSVAVPREPEGVVHDAQGRQVRRQALFREQAEARAGRQFAGLVDQVLGGDHGEAAEVTGTAR